MNDNLQSDQVKQKARRQRGRNIALFLGLLAFVTIVYGVTIVKIRMGYGP